MSRDFDDILKEINKNNRELHSIDSSLSKDISGLQKDITLIKKEIKSINNKIDLVLEILNNFTIMLLDEEGEDTNDLGDYDPDQTWVPEEDDWSNHEDES